MSLETEPKTLENSRQYTVAWIAALPHERAAALMMLDERHKKPHGFVKNRSDPNNYSWGRVASHNVVIASLPEGEYGIVSAAGTANGLQASLSHIRIGLMVGIGAGVPNKDEILLGDVAVSKPDQTNGGVVQYDLYKAKKEIATQQEQGRASVKERKGFLNSPPLSLRHGLSALRAEHEVAAPKIEEYLKVFQKNEITRKPYGFPGAGKDPLRHGKASPRLSPIIHYGTIASGDVLMKDASERDTLLQWLKDDNITPVCLEMEAAGLMNSFPCLVIRGICDYADEGKDDTWQRYAAATAAAFAKELLEFIDEEKVEETSPIGQVAVQPPSSSSAAERWLPSSPRSIPLLEETTYRHLVTQASIIEGPDPPEKFAPKIKRYKERGTWTQSEEDWKSILHSKHFDPNSAEQKTEYLFAACYVGDEENVRRALAAGANVNYTYHSSFGAVNPLHAALAFDHTRVVEILLDAGAHLSHTAAEFKMNEQRYLEYTIEFLSTGTVQLLLKHYGKDILPSSVLAIAACYSTPGVLGVLSGCGFSIDVKWRNLSPAQAAIHGNKLDNLEKVIALGYPSGTLDEHGRTLLFYAVIYRRFDMISPLLRYHINPSVQDNNGNTILHTLLLMPLATDGTPLSNSTIVQEKKLILKSLCDIQMPLNVLNNNGWSALHCAIRFEQVELAEILVEGSADCNLRDSNGFTPLHLCAEYGGGPRSKIAALLIQRGASLKAQLPGPRCLTPYQIARKRADGEMAKLLKDAASDRGIQKWFARH